jgi:hypothetical protein
LEDPATAYAKEGNGDSVRIGNFEAQATLGSFTPQKMKRKEKKKRKNSTHLGRTALRKQQWERLKSDHRRMNRASEKRHKQARVGKERRYSNRLSGGKQP